MTAPKIISVRDKFNKIGVTDLEWISALRQEGGWCVLSADVRISRNRTERDAFLSANLIGFLMAPAVRKKPEIQQLARILTIWRLIESQSSLVSRGLFQFGVSGNKFTQL
jgi:hypothetical protein